MLAGVVCIGNGGCWIVMGGSIVVNIIAVGSPSEGFLNFVDERSHFDIVDLI
jgi:hypothetical protein